MTDNVVNFTGITTLDMEPKRVLDGALGKGLAAVVILGYDLDGKEWFSSSLADGAEVLWLLERLKLKLLTTVDSL
jgi:hypothetical protein